MKHWLVQPEAVIGCVRSSTDISSAYMRTMRITMLEV